METLGQKLARTQALDKARDTAFVERRIAAQGEEALRKLNLVKSYFAEMANRIEAAVKDEEPKVEMLLGSDGTKSEFSEVEGLLLNGRYGRDIEAALERIGHPYHAQWRDFKAWAASEGLVVGLKDCHDGGGIQSWLKLVCQPEPDVERACRRPLLRERC